MTPAWASKAVARLEEAGIVREITGRERYWIYIAWDVLRVLEMDLRREESPEVEQLPLKMGRVDDEEVTVSPS